MSNLMKKLTIGSNTYEVCDASARESLKDKVNYDQLKKAAPRNLLINSDFRNPVNQNGQDTYTNGFTIDKWIMWIESGTGSVDLREGYIKVTFQNHGTLVQRFKKGILDPSKVYTLIFKKQNESPTLSYPASISYDDAYDFATLADLRNNEVLRIEWAALYEGEYTTETMPEYQPRGYETELLICRQYDPTTGEYIGMRKFGQPHNLLDNSYFCNPVNQRGQTSYTNIGYTIDRWVKESNAVVTITDNGIHIDNTANTAAEVFIQKTDEKTAEALMGKTVTLAIKTAEGIFCGSGIVTPDNWAVTVFGNHWTLVLQFFMSSQSYQLARLIVNGAAGVTVEWIALYEGEYTLDTLPEYHPKGYGAELAECQRYFLRLGDKNNSITALGVGHISTENSVAVYIPFPATMRIRATSIVLHDSIQFRNANGFYTSNVVRPNVYGANGMNVWVDTDSTISNVGGAADCWLSKGAYLEFSADL